MNLLKAERKVRTADPTKRSLRATAPTSYAPVARFDCASVQKTPTRPMGSQILSRDERAPKPRTARPRKPYKHLIYRPLEPCATLFNERNSIFGP